MEWWSLAFVACGVCIFGCLSRALEQRSMSWEEVADSAIVEIGDPVLDGTTLHIPLHVAARPEESLRVLCFKHELSGDRIEFTAQLLLPDHAPSEGRNSLSVKLVTPLREVYTVVYINPDGSSRVMKSINLSTSK